MMAEVQVYDQSDGFARPFCYFTVINLLRPISVTSYRPLSRISQASLFLHYFLYVNYLCFVPTNVCDAPF